jgi:hypothetical protein
LRCGKIFLEESSHGRGRREEKKHARQNRRYVQSFQPFTTGMKPFFSVDPA